MNESKSMTIRKASAFRHTISDGRAADHLKALFDPWTDQPNAVIFWAFWRCYAEMWVNLRCQPHFAKEMLIGEIVAGGHEPTNNEELHR